jgi:cell division protein ZapA
MSADTAGVTRVKIFNQTYDIRADDAEYVESLAQFVDERMLEISKLTPTVDSLKVAILAALNIVDELFAVQAKLERLETGINEQNNRLASCTERLVESSHPEAPK